jgi:hypothetical protein
VISAATSTHFQFSSSTPLFHINLPKTDRSFFSQTYPGKVILVSGTFVTHVKKFQEHTVIGCELVP